MKALGPTISVADYAALPAAYRRLIGPTGNRFEPVATRWLVELCRKHRDLELELIENLFSRLNLSQRNKADWSLSDQMWFGRGIRADIVIRSARRNRIVAVIEAKVDDPPCAFQLGRYFDVPCVDRDGALVISLSPNLTATNVYQREVDGLGLKRLTWYQWFKINDRSLSASARIDWKRFVDWCNLCGVLRRTSRQQIVTREVKWEAIGERLSDLRTHLSGWDARLELVPGIAPRLRLGRPAWKNVFGSFHWRRLLIYYHDGVRFGPRESLPMQLLLFHDMDLTGSASDSSKPLASWLELIAGAGLTYYGPSRGRRANRRSEMVFAADAASALKRTFLVTSEPDSVVATNFNGRVKKALPDIKRRLAWYDALVRRLKSPPDSLLS